MLTTEQNNLVTQVGTGTPMGNLMRRYWIPFMKSSDVVSDGQPRTIRLMGEDLLVFRDSNGAVGVIDPVCPHRGAPLVFARNLDCGLRCIYHGWKFNTKGECIDIPTVPNGDRVARSVKTKSYQARERNGVLWVYMGDSVDTPPLPELEWNLVPEENVVVSFRVQECNWLQALEGEIDSAHAAILHGGRGGKFIGSWRQTKDLAPTFELLEREIGVSIGARRNSDEDSDYIRVNQFLMPFWTLVPPQSKYPELSGHAWVPIDDKNTLAMMFSYRPDEAMYPETKKLFEKGAKGLQTGHHSLDAYKKSAVTEPYGFYKSKYNRENSYEYDYDRGLPGLWTEDAACQSGLDPIYDRTRETLVASDTGIVRVRKLLMEQAQKHWTIENDAPGVNDPASYLLRAASLTVPRGGEWKESGEQFMTAKLGTGFGYKP